MAESKIRCYFDGDLVTSSSHSFSGFYRISGNVGILVGQFQCQSADYEVVYIDLPTGMYIPYGGLIIRNVNNGNLVTAWGTSANNKPCIHTDGHSGTMIVGNSYQFTTPIYM